jgi:hypothetical protein
VLPQKKSSPYIDEDFFMPKKSFFMGVATPEFYKNPQGKHTRQGAYLCILRFHFSDVKFEV